MKRFIIQGILFGIGFVSIWLGIFAWCNIRNVRDFRAVLDCEVLSPCNSHEQCGIDYDMFKACGNFNTIASRPWHWESKFRVYLRFCRDKPKIVLIDRGAHDVLGDQNSDEVAADYARFVCFQLLEPTSPYEVSFCDILNYIVGSRPFKVRWVAKPPMGNPKFQWESRVLDHFGRWGEGRLPSEDHIRRFTCSLERLIKLAQDNGIEPVMISTPKYKRYLDAIPPRIQQLNERISNDLVKKYNIRFLDYEKSVDLDETFFLDADHLNKKGRSFFTRVLMKDLGYEN